jgi:DNA-directed RNA polymerase beta' subunit
MEDSIISTFMIDSIKFTLNGNDENNRNGLIAIQDHGLFEPDGSPTPNGLYDLRMGSIDHNNICPICQNGKKLCPGHRGKYVLKYPVMQPLGISQIRKLLKIFCFNCGNLMIPIEKLIELPMHKRLDVAVATTTEGRACLVCKTIHPKIIRTTDDNFTIYAEYNTLENAIGKKNKLNNNKNGDKLYAAVIGNIFSKISNESIKLLNISNPMNLIFNVLVIAPNCIRPSSKNFLNNSSNYHDITTVYQHIIKRNNEQIPDQLPDALLRYIPNAAIPLDIDIKLQNEQQFIYDLILGPSAAVQNGNSGKRGIMIGPRSVNSITRGMNGKEGRIRNNLLGKRVKFMCRSTISGNTGYKIDEVGVPLEFAKIQQIQQTVQDFNREFLMSIFLNGRNQYPGCTHIIKKSTGEMHDVSGLKNDYYLQIGDVVCRNIIDGDYINVNRQPTLECSGIGCHKVIVIKDSSIHTIGFNVISCSWYNADFDGDQMNGWIPHEPASIIEAKIMSHVSNAFISTKSGDPVSGQVQDSKIGCYELTRHFVQMDKIHAMRLFTKTGLSAPNFSKYSNDHIFSGIDIVNLLLESNNITVNYSGVPKTYNNSFIKYIPFAKEEKYTTILDGKMITGVLDSSAIGEKTNGGLFHMIGREYGSKKALEVIYYFQQVAMSFLYNKGSTISISDLYLNASALNEIHTLCDGVHLESEIISNKLINGDIIPPIDLSIHNFYENMQLNALRINDSEILKILLTNINPDTNGLFKMISVGSKGKLDNMMHIMASVGQITINGERIKESASHGQTLPYFSRFSFDSRAGGFINNSYMSGLTVSEFTFGAMNGRFDIINKALSTASTGYMTRKGVLTNQSSITNNHRHVVKDIKIVQFIYGEDGIDSRELETVKFNTIEMNDANLLKYTIPENFDKNYNNVFNNIKSDRDKLRKNSIKLQNTMFGSYFNNSYLLPVNVNRLIKNMVNNIPSLNGLNEKIDRIANLCNNLAYVFLNEIQEVNKKYIPKHKKFAAEMVCISIRAELNPKILSQLTNEQISYIIDFIRYRYSISLIGYGKAVGILAAQAVSEPLTQYMLDSHHRSVEGGTNKSGLIRVMEIYGAKSVSKEQSPSMQLLIKKKYATDIISAQLIANVIEYVSFKNLISKYDVLLESNEDLIYPPYKNDSSWIQEYTDAHPLIKKSPDLTNWCYRFIIDKTALILKAITLELIVRQLKIKYQGMYVVHTSEAVGEIIIRIWPKTSQLGKIADYETRALNFLEHLLDCPIRGIKGIIRATAKKIMRHTIASDGNFITEPRFVIETIGTNLNEVFLYSAIDAKNSISSSVGDTNDMFGIEAARAKIISETISFMQKDAPNLRHLYLYADEMTRTGKFTSLERGGLNAREHNNVLLRAAMSSPIQVFTEASINNTTTKASGISGNMILGAIPKIGTLYNSFVVNEEFIRNNTKSIDSILDDL